ncbi:hypothetical protein [Traorella massiliensis]|uniref:hypothetical protein n=1 Tax=Traorella massiliensis TaxID=1903263 RepID=UPI0012B53F89|nr:hypothetical protein [Traorella massiliensis]
MQILKEARNYEVDFLRKYQDIEISKTKKLLDMGIVTYDEFNQKKKQVLGI